MTGKFCVLERGALVGVAPAETYFSTVDEALAYGAPRVGLFETVELLEVLRRFHTVLAPQTTEEPVAP